MTVTSIRLALAAGVLPIAGVAYADFHAALSDYNAGRYEVKILDVQTAQTRPILRYGKNDRVSSVRSPIWTTDGQRLIYGVSGSKGQGTQLYIVGVDGSAGPE